MQMIEGQYTDADGRYAIVVGRFNQFVVDSLVEGAVALIEPAINGLWFYVLHSAWKKARGI